MNEMLEYTESQAISGMQQLTDYDEITEVLRDRRAFVQGAYSASSSPIHDLVDNTVPACDGPTHLARRRLLGHLMSDEAIARHREDSLYPTIEHTFSAMVEEDRHADGVVRTDLVMLAQRCLYRVAAATAGIDGLEASTTADRFIGHLRRIAAGLGADWALGDPAEVAASATNALEALRVEFFEPSRSRRLQLIETGEAVPDDLITLMYMNWDETWDAGLPLREAAVFMVGATQTTTASLVLLVLRLEDWFERYPGHRSRVTDEPDFLRRAAYESLRMTVAAPARVRLAVEDVELKSGRRIKAGERVALLFLPANEDQDRFGEDAASFNPDRETADGTTSWGLAFGGGTHACLGRPMVTGNRKLDTDGTVAALARRIYAAGVALDGDPVRDETTHYPIYTAVPVRFEAL